MRPLLAFVSVLVMACVALPAHAQRGHGWLQLNSTTTGAQVFVDGEPVGSVPLASKLRLRAGQHTLKMVRRGYTQYLDVFTVRPRQTTALDIDLLPVAGIIKVSASVAEARVFIDGKFVGTTPVEAEVLVGKRRIRVHKAGFYDFEATRQAVAGEIRSVRAYLRPLPVGTTPYRPAPPPPPKLYERWYFWVGIGGGVAAVALGITLTAVLANRNPVDGFGPELRYDVGRLRGAGIRF